MLRLVQKTVLQWPKVFPISNEIIDGGISWWCWVLICFQALEKNSTLVKMNCSSLQFFHWDRKGSHNPNSLESDSQSSKEWNIVVPDIIHLMKQLPLTLPKEPLPFQVWR
jgi:hypothetical protein